MNTSRFPVKIITTMAMNTTIERYWSNTHDDEDALENVSERNHKFRELADIVVSCEIKVHLAPEREVKRSREH